MRSDPTIFALATPRQPAARAVIRISGAASESIFAGACGSTTLATALGSVPAAIWRFPAGASATGEACCELHLPGNLWLIDSVEAMLRDAGLQHAAPGEFTRRAYLNGVLDLASAEAVMALVSSSDRQAARRARAQASGKVSRDIRALTADLEDLCARFEVSFDFDEEAADQVDETRFLRASEVLASRLRAIAGTPQLGRTEVPRIVMAGEANAGKSTLFNALLGRTRAAVADVSGTTRDVVSETLHLQGMNVLLQDTAGLKRPSSGPDSAIEQDALHQTRESVLRADLLLLVVPAPLSGDHDLSTAWHD